MASLSYILTYVDNNAAQGWSTQVIISMDSAAVPVLCALTLSIRSQHTQSSIGHMAGKDNNIADAPYRIKNLSDCLFLIHLCTHLPQRMLWRLLQLPSQYRWNMTTMLHSKLCPRAFLPQSTKKTSPPSTSGENSAAGSISPPTSKSSMTQSPSYRYFQSTCTSAFFSQGGYHQESLRQ